MNDNNFSSAFLEQLVELAQFANLQIPPPVFTEMGGEILAFDPLANSLTVRFPVRARYQNPMGYMQGGMIAAAVDNVIGPLSFMIAPPSVTKTLTMTYLRPIPATLNEIIVQAWLVSAEGRELLFTAEVRRGEGSVLATAKARHHTVRMRNRKKEA